jgi:hypothetical protein
MKHSPLLASSRSQPARDEVLRTWADIARYLGKGVRTVQRYERQFGLPIRRSTNEPRGSVLAIKIELDGWVASAPVSEAHPSTEPIAALLSGLAELRKGVKEMRLLRDELYRSRWDYRAARSHFVDSTLDSIRRSRELIEQTQRLLKSQMANP